MNVFPSQGLNAQGKLVFSSDENSEKFEFLLFFPPKNDKTLSSKYQRNS
jgi:hypothetical protein